ERLGTTWTVQTRSGGQHLYYIHRPGLRGSASKIAPGVDVRADGGYVIAWWALGYRILIYAPYAAWPAFLDQDLDRARGSPAVPLD
ncbi:bifunctional DNA primase/polymerase, partial [Bradyrhizobium sp. 25ACV]